MINLRAIDALVAEKVMGISLKPSREMAMVKVGWDYISMTGRVFELRNGDRVLMPDYKEILCEEAQGNDRYALHVARFLGDKVKAEVDAIRLEPKRYTSDIAAAWEVIEKFPNAPFQLTRLGDQWQCILSSGKAPFMVTEPTAPLAICNAALYAFGVEVPG